MYFHVWFVTKYRKGILSGAVDTAVKQAFHEVAQKKGYAILEMATGNDHVHILLQTKGREELSATMRVLKTVSAKKALALDSSEDTEHFWAKRYGSREVPEKELDTVKKYIQRHNNTKNIPLTYV